MGQSERKDRGGERAGGEGSITLALTLTLLKHENLAPLEMRAEAEAAAARRGRRGKEEKSPLCVCACLRGARWGRIPLEALLSPSSSYSTRRPSPSPRPHTTLFYA